MDKNELLKEAIRRYPIGTYFKIAHCQNEDSYHVAGNWKLEGDDCVACDSIESKKRWSPCLYYNGKWAEIIDVPLNHLDYVYLMVSGFGCGSEDIGIQQIYDKTLVEKPKYDISDRVFAIKSKDGSYKCIDNKAFRPLTQKETESLGINKQSEYIPLIFN